MSATTDKLLDLLKDHEGFKKYPYLCTVGKLTVGYGHNIEDKGVSKAVAKLMLKEDIHDATRDLYSIFPGFHNFPDNQRIALIDLMFNMGLPRFNTFVKMITAIKRGDWQKAADELKDSTWYTQVGVRAPKIESMMRNA